MEAILASVGHRKLALPNVGIMLSFGLQFVAPGEKPVRRDMASAWCTGFCTAAKRKDAVGEKKQCIFVPGELLL